MCEKFTKTSEIYSIGDLMLMPISRSTAETSATAIAQFCNENLDPAYARFSAESILANEKQLKDGRIISQEELWNGTSFCVVDKNDQIVGVALSRRECVRRPATEFQFTGRGTNTILVVAEPLRGTPLPILLLACYIESLRQKGCESIFGSTYIGNTQVDSLFKKFCLTRVEDGDWLRYTLDIDAARQYYTRLLQRLGHTDLLKFIEKVTHGSNEK